MRFRREYAYVYRFGYSVPSMEWWAARLMPDGPVIEWELLTVGAVPYVRPCGASTFHLRSHGGSDTGAVRTGADAAGIVLSAHAAVLEHTIRARDARLARLVAGLEALARQHLERASISSLIFPLERVAAE